LPYPSEPQHPSKEYARNSRREVDIAVTTDANRFPTRFISDITGPVRYARCLEAISRPIRISKSRYEYESSWKTISIGVTAISIHAYYKRAYSSTGAEGSLWIATLPATNDRKFLA